ncbi:hypothetical protein DV737_g4545, partial [Chaetothyriales sp. CBS 132003]
MAASSEDKLRDNEKGTNGIIRADFDKATHHMSHEEKHAAVRAAKFGYGPLAHLGSQAETMLPAFGGEFQPGLYKPVEGRKFANPAPLGLSAFALTTFLLSLINLGTLNVTSPAIIISLAFGYGGLVQLLAGMWEMAVGNTFGATALSSYGGFWISFAIILTPGGFQVEATTESADGVGGLLNLLGLYLMISALAGIADSSNSFFVIPVVHFPWSAKGQLARRKTDHTA